MEISMTRTYMKKIIIPLLLIGAISLIIWIGFFFRNPKENLVEGTSTRYDASKEIKEANRRLKQKEGEATVLSRVDTVQGIVTLTFLNLSDTKTNEKIVDLLSEYDYKGTFMVSGIAAAESSDFIMELKDKGHDIGSTGLSGTKHLEELKQEELVRNFAKTNHIMNSITKEYPVVLQAPSTELTSEVLETAYANGYEYVISSDKFLSYQSFTSFEQVLGFVKSLSKGSIVTIKMDGILDETEYKKEVDEIIKQEDVDNELDETEDTKKDEVELTQVVEWLLMALKEVNYHSVYAKNLPDYQDKDFNLDFAKERELNGGKLAKLYSSFSTTKKEVTLTFRGIRSRENLEKILQFLKVNELKAIFFVTGEELLSEEDSIKKILADGHDIGNGGFTGKDMSALTFKELCFEIYKTNKVLKENYNLKTDLFMPPLGKYNDLMLEAVSALEYQVITYSKNPIIDNRPVEEVMEYFKNGMKKGDVIHLRLDVNDNILAITQSIYEMLQKDEYELIAAKDLLGKLGSVEENQEHHNHAGNTNGNSSGKGTKTPNGGKDITKDVEKDIIAGLDFEKLRKENNGRLSEVISTVHTTTKALSFTFYGVDHTEVLKDVLSKLDQIHGSATFFVTENDIDNFSENIALIIERGHEIGLSLKEGDGLNYKSIYTNIVMMKDKLKEKFGITPKLVQYPYEIQVSNEMREALSSADCTLVWSDVAVAQSSVGKNGTAKEIVDGIFHAGNIVVKRGYIVYFRLDYYEDKSVIGETILDIYNNRIKTLAYPDNEEKNNTSYQVVTLGDLLSRDGRYTYPVKEKDLKVKSNEIKKGHLSGWSEEETFDYIQGRYIGTPTHTNDLALPGFTLDEIEELDKTGRFTEEKVLFLTFDDWSSDKPINQILYILKKYNIKASFYIRTNYMELNPNILRAIALDGHDIGSHTDTHMPFADSEDFMTEEGPKSTYYSLTEEAIQKRKDDLKISFDKLRDVVGDVEVDGRPALTKIFRPPTLAMSKGGMEVIFDMGFEYIVSGDLSTHDYEAKDPEELADTLINGVTRGNQVVDEVHNGSIYIMHIQDDSFTPTAAPDVTAAALDIAIPYLLEQGYKFDKLSNYLNADKGRVYERSNTYKEKMSQNRVLE